MHSMAAMAATAASKDDQQAHQTQPVPGIRAAGQVPFMIRRHRTVCASVVYGMHAFIL